MAKEFMTDLEDKSGWNAALVKKAFKEIAMAIGFMAGFIGICICACEAPTMEQQIRNFGIGFVVMAVGAVVTYLASRGNEDVYTG